MHRRLGRVSLLVGLAAVVACGGVLGGAAAATEGSAPVPTKAVSVREHADHRDVRAHRRIEGVQFVSSSRGFLSVCYLEGPSCPMELLVTRDGGRTWKTRRQRPPREFWFVTPRLGYGVRTPCLPWRRHRCRDRIVATTDGGRHWRGIARLRLRARIDVRDSSLSIDFPTPSTGFLDADGAILRTTDGGYTWRGVPMHCGLYGLDTSISFPTPTTGFLSCDGEAATDMSGKSMVETQDGGSTWRVIARIGRPVTEKRSKGGLPIVGNGATISFPSPTTGFMMAERFGLVRSSDGGRTFQPHALLLADDEDSVTGTSWLSPMLGYAALEQQGLIRTLDGGEDWSLVYRGSAKWSIGRARS